MFFAKKMKSVPAVLWLVAAVCPGTLLAEGQTADVLEAESGTSFVFVRPKESSYWHTFRGGSLSLPISFPDGASSATLKVSGIGYSAVYEDITADEFEIALPEAVSAETENVYALRLEFDDGTVRETKLGVIQWLSEGAEGSAVCRPAAGNAWGRVPGRAVLPVPYGTTSLMVNGEPVDTGLDGAQGWYAVDKVGGRAKTYLSLLAGDDVYESWIRGITGLNVVFR